MSESDEDCLYSNQSQLNNSLIEKLFDDDIDNEEKLFELLIREDFPKFILNKDNVHDGRFDYLLGLTNLLRRLMRLHDEAVNKWIGLDFVDENKVVSIFEFLFEFISKECFEAICYPQVVKYADINLSIYDYVVTLLCSFIMTFNPDQIEVVEDFLFQNLFSPVLIKAMMASDIFCFMCRTSKEYAYDTVKTLLTFLQDNFFEDIKTKKEQTPYNVHQVKQILLNLCQRILRFLSDDEIEGLREIIMESNFRKDLDFQFFEEPISKDKKYLPYDEVYAISKFSKNQSLFVSEELKNFLRSNGEYELLIHLRILKNLPTKLNHEEFSTVVEKARRILESNSLVYYREEFCLTTLKLLDKLSLVEDDNFQNTSFTANLYKLLVVLYKECECNFISKQYFFSAIQNVCSNPIFEDILISLSKESKIKTYLKFHLNYYMKSCYLLLDEKEIYINELKELYETIITEENEEFFQFTFLHFKFNQPNQQTNGKFIDNQIKRNVSESLFEELEHFIEKMKNIDKLSVNEKRRLLTLSNKLIEVINQIDN